MAMIHPPSRRYLIFLIKRRPEGIGLQVTDLQPHPAFGIGLNIRVQLVYLPDCQDWHPMRQVVAQMKPMRWVPSMVGP